jgi:multisubunit Na+/H+ antiporter MnhC subunit
MNVLIAIVALAICAVAITVAMRIYKENPKIRKNDRDDFLD